MCGTVYILDRDIKIGNPCPLIMADGKQVEATWNGFAKSETVENWIRMGWQSSDLVCSGFNEQGRQYDIPAGHCIKALVRQVGSGKYVFQIQTREAEGEEKQVHPRFPVVIHRRF